MLLILQNQEKKLVLSLHYNGYHSFLIVNATKIFQFKEKIQKYKPIHYV